MADWADLRHELDLWEAAGRLATLWWRDDDAQTATPALRQLQDLAGDHGVPVSLAVIPRGASASLAEALHSGPFRVLQHGYAHTNHAPPPHKKCELGAHRPLGVVQDELQSGRASLSQLFDSRFLPALVPPWNRIDATVTSSLGALGFAGLSAYTPRRSAVAAPGVALVNTHVDPIAWRQGRMFLGVPPVLRTLVGHLQARRLGTADPDEPTGLLTHHLVHDADTWQFVRALLAQTTSHPASRWLGAEQVFGIISDR